MKVINHRIHDSVIIIQREHAGFHGFYIIVLNLARVHLFTIFFLLKIRRRTVSINISNIKINLISLIAFISGFPLVQRDFH